MSREPGEAKQTDGDAPMQTAVGRRLILEIDAEELDEMSGGFLPEFRRRSMQPDGGGGGAHH
jgi:hypothetical protein